MRDVADGSSVPAIRVLDEAPTLPSLYLRAVLPAIPGGKFLVSGGSAHEPRQGLPELRLVLRDIVADEAHVDRYRDVCRFPTRDVLPATYPHILAFPLQLSLLTDASFPFAAMGTIHLSNRIEQRRPLAIADAMNLAVWAERLSPHRRGRTVVLMSEVDVDGEVVWREETVLLSRGDGDPSAPDVHTDLPSEAPPAPARWPLDAGLGRRYAAVSGDRNPIHLYDVTAKAFGFRRHIAHGMWTKARCLAALDNRLPEAYSVVVVFRKPIELPGTVTFGARTSGALLDFGVRTTSGGAHLLGRVAPGE